MNLSSGSLAFAMLAGLFSVSLGHAADTEPTLNAYFGDLHLHTRFSNDAYAIGSDRTPDSSYRYAKGEPISTSDGRSARIDTPLDFLAVTDHAEFLGAMQAIGQPGSEYSGTELGQILQRTHAAEDDSSSGLGGGAFMAFVRALRSGEIPEGLDVPQRERSVWQRIVAAADAHYAPGEFTTFAAYEWTASLRRSAEAQGAGNMHRNVIFKNTDDLPHPFSSRDSTHPERLWAYLERQRMRGVEVLAIPHNPNVSDGLMFATSNSYGEPMDDDYAARRMWNEPLVEVTQQKGTSETHPLLSPNDEFADFELFTELLITNIKGQVSGSYVREAYRNGLEYRATQGFNPFQFGLVGATDFHDGITSVGENRPEVDPVPPSNREDPTLWGGLPRQAFSTAGLTAVWAEENTREAIFDALRRRETYATTGPRMRVRFFGGWSFNADMINSQRWPQAARAEGVPMGGTLEGAPGDDAPVFIVEALKDAQGANLDRVQIVKGWYADGASHEKVFDVALSDDREVDRDGKAGLVGNTVSVGNASYTNEIGAAALRAIWADPEFDSAHPAFYYVRVIEIPTPRWTTYDAAARGEAPRDDVPETIQERAFTSPIWYEPSVQLSENRTPNMSTSPERAVFAALSELPDEPIVMLNLLEFSDGDGTTYGKYGRATMPHIQKRGGKILYSGVPVADTEEGGHWDRVALVYYPSPKAFLDMMSDPDYQKGLADRAEGLKRTVVYAFGQREGGPPLEEVVSSEGGEIFVLNLLRFKPNGGREEYNKYGNVVLPMILERGGGPVLTLNGQLPLVSDETWEDLYLVRYPNLESLQGMVASEAWQKANEDRQRGLDLTWAFPTRP